MATLIDELIFDRTQSDVDYVRTLKQKILLDTITDDELAEYMAGLKGAFNATDLNRLGNTVIFIAELLNSFGKNISVTMKTDWTVYDVPTNEQANAFLNGIKTIKNAEDGVTSTIPDTLDRLDYEKLNGIEKALYQAANKYVDSASAIPHISFVCGRPTIGNRR